MPSSLSRDLYTCSIREDRADRGASCLIGKTVQAVIVSIKHSGRVEQPQHLQNARASAIPNQLVKIFLRGGRALVQPYALSRHLGLAHCQRNLSAL